MQRAVYPRPPIVLSCRGGLLGYNCFISLPRYPVVCLSSSAWFSICSPVKFVQLLVVRYGST